MSPSERLVDPELRLQHALDLAYRYLGRRDRTVREVRQHLERGRVEPATIDKAVIELTRAGYLDDARYALRFAEDRRALDAWGRERIERKLRTLGVTEEQIAEALAADGVASERTRALGALRRRFAEPPQTPRDRERALGFLVRKGYETELAYEVIRTHAPDAAS
jgi:regulatory protein